MHFFSSCSCFHPIKDKSLSPQFPFCRKHFLRRSWKLQDCSAYVCGLREEVRLCALDGSQKKSSLFLQMRKEAAKYPCLAVCSVEAHETAAETTPQRCGPIRRKTQIPSPSLAGQTVIVDQAVLLAPVHRSSAPSQVSPVTSPADSLADTVAGPRRLFSGFSIESCDT